MTHSVHTAHGIVLQDTEGEHHGGTQLVLSSMPQTWMQTLKIAPQKNLPECYTTIKKSPNLHIVQRTISGGEEALLRPNRMNLLCCPFVTALQMSCPRELTILWTFAVWSSAVTNKRYFKKVFSSVGRTLDCRLKSLVGSHGKFLTFKRLQQSCFSSTEQHLAPCELS